MNSRTKRISFVVIGALILSLFAVLPASGAGAASFIDPDAFDDANVGALKNPDRAPDEQKWARQGGFIGLMYEDDSLNRPVRRVLIPYLDTTPIGCSDIEAHDNTIKVKTESLAVNDYVMIGGYNVRKVLKVIPPIPPETEGVVTLDKPFYKSGSRQDVHKIKTEVIDAVPEVDWHNDYGLYARATVLEYLQNVSYHAGLTRYAGGNDVADSNIANTYGSAAPDDDNRRRLARRLTGKGTGSTNHNDALIVRVTETRVTENGESYITGADYYTGTKTYAVTDVRNERIEFTVSDASSEDPLSISSSDEPRDKVYLVAWFEERNDTGAAVAVRSQAYQADTTLVLRETLSNSGKFALKVKAVKYGADKADTTQFSKPVINDADGVPKLPVNPRDVVTMSTPDSTGILTIETYAPTFTGFSPSHSSYGRNARPEVSAQVTDTDSGLAAKNIHILLLVQEEGLPDRGLIYTPSASGDVDEISGGFRVRNRLPGADAPTKDATISWWLMATDAAGNVGFSDRVTTLDGSSDTCAETSADVGDTDAARTTFIAALEDKECDPYVIYVDRTEPNFLRAETGRYWGSTLITGKSADKTEYRVIKSDKSSVMAIFDSHLDAASVSASDFEVNGSPPRDAIAYNVKVRQDAKGAAIPYDGNSHIADNSTLDVGQNRGYVFLRLYSDLKANATPEVELVGEVLDLAGNELDTGKDDSALDRIAPTLTVTADLGNRPVTNDKINLTITSDENIGAPNITFRQVMSETVEGKTTQTLGGANEGYVTVKFVSATEYRAAIVSSVDKGLFTIVVEATDAAGGNMGSAGDATEPSDDNPTPIDLGDATDAILFERDKSLPNPDVDPGADGAQNKFSTEDPNTFIYIDFSAEDNEYDDRKGTDPNDEVTFDKRIGTDLDTHARVTIVSATLNGVDISGLLQANEASNVFMYKASGLSIGDHKLEVVAQDEAGNRHSVAKKATITITERKPFSLKLNPGWNLVSIPGDPANPAINAVIPADRVDITAALAHDPSASGQWLEATRGADGMFTGTLKNIVPTRAYWIAANSFASLKIDIPKPPTGQARIKPTIPIVEGWNIIPILDVDGDFDLSFPNGKNYFSSLTSTGVAIIAIDTFNTITNRWESVAPQDVEIGKGYWIHASGPGVIVP